MAYFRVIVVTLMPIVMAFIFVPLTKLFLSKCKRKNLSKFFGRTSVLHFWFTSQTSIIYLCFQLISCRNLGNESYLKADLSIQCDDKELKFYNLIVVLPVLIILTILFPAGLFYIF